MSLKKSNTRRISLLAGSSVIAASLSAAISMGLSLTPTTALAYDECTPAGGTGTLTDGPGGVSDPSLNGGASDTFTCLTNLGGTGFAYTPEGSLTINALAGTDGGTGTAIKVLAGTGDVTINSAGLLSGAGFSGDTDWVVSLEAGAGSTVTLNNTGAAAQIFGRNKHLASGSSNRFWVEGPALQGLGAGNVVINSSGWILGRADFSGLTGDSEINVLDGGLWETTGVNTFGSGDDRLTIAEGGLVQTGFIATGDVIEGVAAEFDFGDGENVIANAGYLVLHPVYEGNSADIDQFEAETRLIHLTRFENSGVIVLGGARRSIVPTINLQAGSRDPDRWYDDILSMPGATFQGLAGSRIVMDVNLNSSQAACDGALRNSAGDMPAADCVAIQGGTTEGETLLTINDLFRGDRGGLQEIVLIDVSGGTSAAGHFLIDPDSAGYSPDYGGVIDKGFFVYPLVYDADTQQHKLVGVLGENAMQFPVLAQAAQAMWRTSTGSWFDRQADLRGGLEDSRGGIWLRVNSEFANRDTLQTSAGAGTTFEFAGAYAQDTYALTGGADLIVLGGGAQSFLAGLTLGYAHSQVEFEQNDNATELNGWTGGAYASFVSGGLFVDAALNAGKSMMEADIPSLDLFPEGSLVRTEVLSVGAQLEAGWRFPLVQAAFVEPLVSASYVRTSSDQFQVKSDDPARNRIDLDFDDPTSLRAAVGGRFGVNQDFGGIRAQYTGLLRVWNEFEDEAAVSITSLGRTSRVTDGFLGQVTEVGLGANIFGMDGVFSAFINLGGKFGDDYEAKTASIGVRVAW